MKPVAVLASLLLLLAGSATAQTKPDFSGSWVLDVEHSWSGSPSGPPLPPETLDVSQNLKELSFERSSERVARVVRLYDEASPRTSPEGYPIVGRRAQWNGKALDVMILNVDVGSAPVPGVTGDSVQVNVLTWSLNADGNVLTVEGTESSRDARASDKSRLERIKVTRVYRRQHPIV
jgi:hypothetical protein